MERRKLTREDVEKAERYIPLARKYAIAQVLASGCVEKTEAAPPIWQENIVGRKLVELYVLVGFYLRLADVSGLEEGKFTFTLEDYDQLAGVRYELGTFREPQDQEILADYTELMDILDREIKGLLARKNDILARLGELARLGATPEAFQQFQEAIQQAEGGEAE